VREDDAELDFEPKVSMEEAVDTYHLHAFAVLIVLVGVDQMLGYGATDLLSRLTEEFQLLERQLA
jgi:hypothetical protein